MHLNLSYNKCNIDLR